MSQQRRRHPPCPTFRAWGWSKAHRTQHGPPLMTLRPPPYRPPLRRITATVAEAAGAVGERACLPRAVERASRAWTLARRPRSSTEGEAGAEGAGTSAPPSPSPSPSSSSSSGWRTSSPCCSPRPRPTGAHPTPSGEEGSPLCSRNSSCRKGWTASRGPSSSSSSPYYRACHLVVGTCSSSSRAFLRWPSWVSRPLGWALGLGEWEGEGACWPRPRRG